VTEAVFVYADRTQILRYLERAFSETPYPGDDNICESEPEVAEAFRGRHWRDIDIALIVPDQMESLCSFTPEAYRYYLPGYLTVIAKDCCGSDVAAGCAVSTLTPPAPEDSDLHKETAKNLRDILTRLPTWQIPETPAPEEIMEMIEYLDREEYPHESLRRLFEQRVRLMTGEEKGAIALWLAYMDATHGDDFWGNGPSVALQRYWRQFLPGEALN